MRIYLNDYKLPDIYYRGDKKYYLDPIRKKLIYASPEETVRQKVIAYLIEVLKVPTEMINVEEKISHYEIESKKRADIIIDRYDEQEDIYYPVAVVECKAVDIFLDEKTIKQAYDYADKIKCEYIMITNGYEMLCYKNDYEEGMIDILKIPKYKDMLHGQWCL